MPGWPATGPAADRDFTDGFWEILEKVEARQREHDRADALVHQPAIRYIDQVDGDVDARVEHQLNVDNIMRVLERRTRGATSNWIAEYVGVSEFCSRDILAKYSDTLFCRMDWQARTRGNTGTRWAVKQAARGTRMAPPDAYSRHIYTDILRELVNNQTERREGLTARVLSLRLDISIQHVMHHLLRHEYSMFITTTKTKSGANGERKHAFVWSVTDINKGAKVAG